MNETLTQDQQIIFDLIEGTNDNILVHGKPGVGKSVLIRALDTLGTKRYTKAAPTGLAAINIGNGAKTLHSLFGIPTSAGILSPDFNKFTNNDNVIKHARFDIKHLIIDEISMVRCDVLDYIDRFLKFVKGNQLPFGGIQVIAVGDFFQLPPVVNREDKDALKAAGWQSEFAFDAQCFQSFKPLLLNEVLRQKGDTKFIDLLHNARGGDMPPKQITLLNKQVASCNDLRVRLVGTNRQADEINLAHLRALPDPSREYHANSFGNWPAFPAETVLTLKVGAQILVKKNGADRPPGTKGKYPSQVVNGSLGVVVEIPEPVSGETPYIKVELRNGEVVPIYWARWEQKVKEKIGDQWTERITAYFEQLPIQLAWAISMHKSQGQSFDFVHVDASKIFAAGQLYVALSRCRSLAGLSLESPVTPQSFWTNRRVVQFSAQLEEESESIKSGFSKLKQ